MSLLFSVHDLLRTKRSEQGESQRPHKQLPTSPDNPKIRHTSASQKRERTGQCFPAWPDPKKHLRHLLNHSMPAPWPGDSATAGLSAFGKHGYRGTRPDALRDTLHVHNCVEDPIQRRRTRGGRGFVSGLFCYTTSYCNTANLPPRNTENTHGEKNHSMYVLVALTHLESKY